VARGSSHAELPRMPLRLPVTGFRRSAGLSRCTGMSRRRRRMRERPRGSRKPPGTGRDGAGDKRPGRVTRAGSWQRRGRDPLSAAGAGRTRRPPTRVMIGCGPGRGGRWSRMSSGRRSSRLAELAQVPLKFAAVAGPVAGDVTAAPDKSRAPRRRSSTGSRPTCRCGASRPMTRNSKPWLTSAPGMNRVTSLPTSRTANWLTPS
jgi:hypothetical protein